MIVDSEWPQLSHDDTGPMSDIPVGRIREEHHHQAQFETESAGGHRLFAHLRGRFHRRQGLVGCLAYQPRT